MAVKNAGRPGAVSEAKARIYRDFLEGVEEHGTTPVAAIQEFFCPLIYSDDEIFKCVPGETRIITSSLQDSFHTLSERRAQICVHYNLLPDSVSAV
jgi:hypothetical protein